ncbi:hypothetical protein SPRG_05731 [Saprolegnia parasitica CBS 223.65]|uniref:SUEL-type lectin domain-containing protein n=1 Tax=Saprolegnia parasitica (strain CBS 223.65) TaxID=695850 RepID=A0A067CI42_SAPPC|nr:hypothetical protein SPRG_05731 [Saprolegnia parasitica CBS 223.65]KDO28860.1 hypothetical protein SPRG_05731 [Saprolegnia parasitica CBS 223.65]|eukprot:XP_012200405.1 hypothetical protein SPRG_05731 [Saprolegnia parasitica CBS 223.65]
MASIDFASYGTPKNYVEGTCSAATSSGVVAAACVGRPVCNVAVNPSVFGDPCPGTVKTLSARAMCTPHLTPGFIQSMGPQGGSTVVTCPRGEIISDIPFASYGTPSGLAAPSQCHAASSESIVKARCIGKRTCTVDATNGIFGDPCPGFTKSLFIAAQCSSANLVGGSVPDGSTLTIACPLTQRLVSIPYASYGTPTGTYPNFVTTWCNATDTATVVTTACVGRNACSVKADSNEFGDPCPGVTKQLSVVAKCVDNNLIGGSVADGGSAAIQCPAGQYIGSIPFAAYGTPYGTFPDYSAHAACNADGAAAKIASQCVGRNSCAVSVSTQTFGDPCEGEAKTLDWTAKCAPNNVIGTIVNDGGSATLQCPLGHYMSAINFASYGTPGGNFPDYAIDTTCHAASSTSIATSACVGKSTCTLLASTGSFSDPCPTVAKSLAVSADCISNLVIGGTAAQNTMMNLACPKGATVRSIDFASYGTPTGKLGAFALSACHDPNSVRIVQQACLGKTGCSISASNSVFVNNCRRTQMYLAVQATCATPTPATTALRTPTPS